jgi:thiol-disulfide isomerase/thioredoxin
MTSRLPSALALAALLGCASLRGAQPVRGAPAPALVATLLDGARFDLAQQRGQVVLVNFWASWCEPCRAEMPWLDSFYREHRAQGLVVLGVSEDARRERAEVLRAMAGLHYPAALGSEAGENGFGAQRLLPMTYVIDRQGALAAIIDPGAGGATERIAEAVLPLLESGR